MAGSTPSKAAQPPAGAAGADPTAAELAEAGVELVSNPEPSRARFRESKLEGEPETDRKLTLEDGVELRERIERAPLADERVSAGPVAEGGYNLVITHALLTPEGEVARGPDGSFRIKQGSHRHEAMFDAERMGAMSDDQILAALLQQREVAAHKAALFFAGLQAGERLFGERVAAPAPSPAASVAAGEEERP